MTYDHYRYWDRPPVDRAAELAEARRRANENLMKIRANAPNRPKAAM